MTNSSSQQQPLYSLHTLRQEAANPHANPQQVLEALLPYLDGMETLQQQLADAQAMNAQASARGQPLQETINVLTQLQQSSTHYMQQTSEILATLSRRGRHTPAPLPSKFKGAVDGVTYVEFMSQLENAFNRYPEALDTDKAKISYAFASMEGPPAQYFAPFVAGQVPDSEGYLTSYATFIKALDTTFGNQLQVDEASHQLQRLRQYGTTITLYTTTFKTLVARTGWEPNAALGRYKDGLSHEIKELLLNQWSSLRTLEDTIAAATNAYRNMMTHNRYNKKDHRLIPKNAVLRRFPGQTNHTTAAAPGPGPMEIDAMRVKHITSEEKQRRRENNLCLYCGGSGHYVTKCPAKKAHLAAVSIEPLASDSENELA